MKRSYGNISKIEYRFKGCQHTTRLRPDYLSVCDGVASWPDYSRDGLNYSAGEISLKNLSYLKVLHRNGEVSIVKNDETGCATKKDSDTPEAESGFKSPVVVTAIIGGEVVKFLAEELPSFESGWVIFKTPNGTARVKDQDIVSSIPQADIL